MDVGVLVQVGAVTPILWEWEQPQYTHYQYLVTTLLSEAEGESGKER